MQPEKRVEEAQLGWGQPLKGGLNIPLERCRRMSWALLRWCGSDALRRLLWTQSLMRCGWMSFIMENPVNLLGPNTCFILASGMISLLFLGFCLCGWVGVRVRWGRGEVRGGGGGRGRGWGLSTRALRRRRAALVWAIRHPTAARCCGETPREDTGREISLCSECMY